MATGKKSFILYCDQKGLWDKLDNEQAGKLIKHILSYVNDDNPEEPDFVTGLAFEPIKQQLKRDLKKWEKQHEQRVKAGKASAEKRKRNPTTVDERSVSSTVNGNVNVNDTVNDILLEKETKELFNTWIDYRKEIKKPVKADSTKISLAKKIQEEGFEKSKLVIEASIQNGYQGLFWDKTKPSTDNTGHIDYDKVTYP